jgi:hypothetical protein
MEKIVDTARFFAYCLVFLYGIKYIFSLETNYPIIISIFWFLIWLAETIRYHYIKRFDRWSQV